MYGSYELHGYIEKGYSTPKKGTLFVRRLSVISWFIYQLTCGKLTTFLSRLYIL